MGRRRISATARRPALAATHQRASQARQRRPSGAAAAAAPGAAAAAAWQLRWRGWGFPPTLAQAGL